MKQEIDSRLDIDNELPTYEFVAQSYVLEMQLDPFAHVNRINGRDRGEQFYLVKIGAGGPSRLREHQMSNPCLTRIVYFGENIERALHKIFKSERWRGEWFYVPLEKVSKEGRKLALATGILLVEYKKTRKNELETLHDQFMWRSRYDEFHPMDSNNQP